MSNLQVGEYLGQPRHPAGQTYVRAVSRQGSKSSVRLPIPLSTVFVTGENINNPNVGFVITNKNGTKFMFSPTTGEYRPFNINKNLQNTGSSSVSRVPKFISNALAKNASERREMLRKLTVSKNFTNAHNRIITRIESLEQQARNAPPERETQIQRQIQAQKEALSSTIQTESNRLKSVYQAYGLNSNFGNTPPPQSRLNKFQQWLRSFYTKLPQPVNIRPTPGMPSASLVRRAAGNAARKRAFETTKPGTGRATAERAAKRSKGMGSVIISR